MTEHDLGDEGSELLELRELHGQDRMPADVRERLMRHIRDEAGHQRLLASVGPAPSALAAGLPGPPRIGQRRHAAAFGLGASALVAAAIALSIGNPLRSLDVAPQREPAESEGWIEAKGSDATGQSLAPTDAPKKLRIVGWLVQGSLQRMPSTSTDRPASCGHRFWLRPMTGNANQVLRVDYAQCGIPDALNDTTGECVQVTAEGQRASDGHVDASRVAAQLVHCQP